MRGRIALAPQANAQPFITVDVQRQELTLVSGDGAVRRYPVSTASKGTGCLLGSNCTPVGEHRIRLRIGHGRPLGAVFRSRRPTGEVFVPGLASRFRKRDWILTRILWLEGTEPGINRGGLVDTLRRYVYIHGTAEEHLIGQPVSHGCIRMTNADVADLFDLVSVGTRVRIG